MYWIYVVSNHRQTILFKSVPSYSACSTKKIGGILENSIVILQMHILIMKYVPPMDGYPYSFLVVHSSTISIILHSFALIWTKPNWSLHNIPNPLRGTYVFILFHDTKNNLSHINFQYPSFKIGSDGKILAPQCAFMGLICLHFLALCHIMHMATLLYNI